MTNLILENEVMSNTIRSLFILIFICAFFQQGCSQFNVGIKGGAGLNYVAMSYGSEEGSKPLVSVHFGGFIEWQVASTFHLISELQYINKGYSIREDQNNKMEYDKFRISYIELPVLMNYKIAKWFSVEFGPSLAVKIGSHYPSPESVNNHRSLVPNSINSLDFGLVGGFRFHITNKWAFITRYNQGLSTAEEYWPNIGPYVDRPPSQKRYNKNIQLSVAYLLK